MLPCCRALPPPPTWADYLVKKGMPFRDSHEVVALTVRHAEQQGVDIADLSLDTLRQFSTLIEQDVYSVLTPEGSLAQRDHVGGTAPNQVTLPDCPPPRPPGRLSKQFP